jgi:hypothetical protein
MTARRILAIIALLLLFVAIHTLFVGYDSYTPVLFAQLYLGLIAIVMMFPTLVRTDESAGGDHPIVLVVSGVAGVILFRLAAPHIGEPNYCGYGDLIYSVVRVPTVYRCTTAPFTVAGWFAGWWFGLWASDWWTTKLGFDSTAAEEESGESSLSVRAVMILAVTLMIVASLGLFVGARSFKPLVFAEIYIWLFTIFTAIGTRLRAEQIDNEPDWYVLFAAALVGAVVFWNLAPQIGEPNYCMPPPRALRVLRDMSREISRSVGVTPPPIFRPQIYRCTSLPLGVVGGFAGWWIALWAVRRRGGGRGLTKIE